MAEVQLNITTEYDDKGIKELQGGLGKVKSVAAGLAPIAAGAGLAFAGALGGATVAATNFADDANAGMAEFASLTGTAKADLEAYKDVALDVFSGEPPLGENIRDVARAMAEVEQSTGLTGGALEKATEQALTLRDRMDQDLTESLRTADTLVKTGLARSTEEAFDIMANGIQEGLDKSGDFLDTLNEYSDDFEEAGFSAEDALNIINNGLEAGVFNTDKIGDSLNEAFINLKDPAIIDNLSEIDTGLADIARQFASGEITGEEAFEQIIAGLESIEDPIARNQAGVEIFRSMWEDLGEDAILALGDTRREVEGIEGSLQKAQESGTSLGESWQALVRDAQVNLEPIGQEIIPIVQEAFREFSGFLEEARPTFEAFSQAFAGQLAESGPRVADALTKAGKALGVIDEHHEGTAAALDALESFLSGVVGTVELFTVLVEKMAEAVKIAADLAGMLQKISEYDVTDIAQAAGGAIAAEAGVSGRAGRAAVGALPGVAAAGALGFQFGGGFTVGGSGGIDSQLVQFRGTPGERVTITKPGGGGGLDIGRIPVDGPNGQMIASQIRAAVQETVRSALSQFQQEMISEFT